MCAFLVCIIHHASIKSYRKLADTHIYSYTVNIQAQIQCLLETLLHIIPSVSPCKYCMSNMEIMSDKHVGGDNFVIRTPKFQRKF